VCGPSLVVEVLEEQAVLKPPQPTQRDTTQALRTVLVLIHPAPAIGVGVRIIIPLLEALLRVQQVLGDAFVHRRLPFRGSMWLGCHWATVAL
jgi:hypothetical protein